MPTELIIKNSGYLKNIKLDYQSTLIPVCESYNGWLSAA